jgi:hypothetical protein
MIVDPCNAELGPTAYRGSDGIVSRFRNNLTFAGATTKTGFIYVNYPAYNTVYAQNVNSGDVFAPNTLAGPGQAFLLASGESQRVVGACSGLTYTGTALDKSGIVYSGVIPFASLGTGKTIDQLITLMQHESRIPEAPLELKWSPGPAEEEYWQTGSVVPEGAGDRNCLVFIVLGLNFATTSTNFAVINTLISEWRPEAGIGLSTPNPSSHDVTGGLEKVRSALQKMGHWWYGTAKYAYNAINSPTGRMVQTIAASFL